MLILHHLSGARSPPPTHGRWNVSAAAAVTYFILRDRDVMGNKGVLSLPSKHIISASD